MPEIPSIVIENGSATTRAGFSTENEPSLSFSSAYAAGSKSNFVFGDDNIDECSSNDIFTMMNDGIVYNWDALEANWSYVFEQLQAPANEFPLVVTEQLWNNQSSRIKLTELAFEKFDVPIFNIIKNPLAITYGMGKSTSLVIDIGAATTSITPIVDGTILYKGALHTKFAGDFVNLHILNYLNNFEGWNSNESNKNYSESYKMFKSNQILNDFKQTVTQVSNFPIANSNANFNIPTKHYELPNSNVIDINKEQVLLLEPLFHPKAFKLPNIELPDSSLGLIELILTGLKKLEVNDQIYSQLLSNIIITGGSSLLTGLEARVLDDLRRYVPNFHSQTAQFAEPNDRITSVWQGASVLSMMNSFDTHYISKNDWLEKGDAVISEKFK